MNATAIVANHYQNENCHPDGKIKVGIAAVDYEHKELIERLLAAPK